jgi:hypothetical protein
MHPQAGLEPDERMGHARQLRHLGRLRAARRCWPAGARQEYRSRHPCTTFARPIHHPRPAARGPLVHHGPPCGHWSTAGEARLTASVADPSAVEAEISRAGRCVQRRPFRLRRPKTFPHRSSQSRSVRAPCASRRCAPQLARRAAFEARPGRRVARLQRRYPRPHRDGSTQ